MTDFNIEAMLTLKGVHGTNRAAAQQIAQHCFFQKTDKGRAGTGVYVWRDNVHAKDLALCWYEYRVRKGDFKPNEAAIVYVNISVKEDEFWDLEDPLYKDALSVFAIQQPEILPLDDDGRDFGALYDLFIEELEKEAVAICKTFQIRIPAPPRCERYPTPLLGNPIAYVVRDETCIHLTNIEEL